MTEIHKQKVLTLYVGTGCHLCDLARAIVDGVVGAADYEIVNITGDDSLRAAYGERIPVVKNAAGREKGWPFTAGQVKRLVSS